LTFNEQVRLAVALRAAIEASGGLVAQADIARRWGIGRARANELCSLPDFPEPVAVIGRSAVYAGHEVDAWRIRRGAMARGGTMAA
jgi:predicted DNA-binding transcriptional regulator AlpA